MDIKEVKEFWGLWMKYNLQLTESFQDFLFNGKDSILKNLKIQAMENDLSINKGGRVYSISDNFTKVTLSLSKKIKKISSF